MDDDELLALRFEENRAHLAAVAYRMLGSVSEADDAVQESWIRLSRADTHDVENLAGWLTTVVARVCLDQLRSRASRRQEHYDEHTHDTAPAVAGSTAAIDPEQEAVLADSVGLALLVVLETLAPAERLAFVLHDMFAVPFDEIAPLVGRSSEAARQLASRARRRVQGGATVPVEARSRQREVVAAFLDASRRGDFDALVAVLDPEVVLRSDGGAAGPVELRGPAAVAAQATTFSERRSFARMALVDGNVGVVVAPAGRLLVAYRFVVAHDKVVEIEVVTEPAHLARLELAVVD